MKPIKRIKVRDLEGQDHDAVRSADTKAQKQWMLVDPVRLLSTEDDEHFVDGDGRPYSRV